MSIYKTLLEKISYIFECGNEVLITKQIGFVDGEKFINYCVFSERKTDKPNKIFEDEGEDIDIEKIITQLSKDYIIKHISTPIVYSDFGKAQIELYMYKIIGKKLKKNSNPYKYGVNKILTVGKLENILTSIRDKDTVIYVYPKYNVGEFEKAIFDENVKLDDESNLRIIY